MLLLSTRSLEFFKINEDKVKVIA